MLHKYYLYEKLDIAKKYDESAKPGNYILTNEESANLVSSELNDSFNHAPVLDLDIPAQLIPSSTPGHSHLYIDVPMSWDSYMELLLHLARLRIIEPGFARAAIAQGKSMVRRQGVYKPGVVPPKTEEEKLREENDQLRAELAGMKNNTTLSNITPGMTWS